jgi:hypothetical protein
MGTPFLIDIGDHRAEKFGFKACVIMALPVNTGKPDED